MRRIIVFGIFVLFFGNLAGAAPVIPEIAQRATAYFKTVEVLRVDKTAVQILREIKLAQAEKNIPRLIGLSEQLVVLNPESFQSWLQLANAWKALDAGAEKGLAAGFRAYGFGRSSAEQVEALLLLTSILRTQLAKYSESYQQANENLKASIRKGEDLNKLAKALAPNRDNSSEELRLTEQAREIASRAAEEALQQISRVAIALDEIYKDIALKLPGASGLNVTKMQAGDSRSATFAPLTSDQDEDQPRVYFRNADAVLRACIGFTQELKANSLSYRDAITIQQDLPEVEKNDAPKEDTHKPPGKDGAPKTRVAKKEIKDFGFEAKGRELCLTGLKSGEQYSLQLLSKFASKQGATLGRDFSPFDVTMPDLPKQVAFSGRNFILPAAGPGEIPLRITNVSRFEIELFRITDRLIHRHIALGHIGGSLPHQEYEDLRLRFGEGMWSGAMGIVDVEKKANKTLRASLPVRQILKDRLTWITNGGSGQGQVPTTTSWAQGEQTRLTEDIWLQGGRYYAGPGSFETTAIGRPMPGVYALVVQDQNDTVEQPDDSTCNTKCDKYLVQWFVDTDIGLTFYEGDRDFTVVARSLSAGTAKAKAKIELVSSGNRVLMSGETDENGVAKFPKSITRGTQSNALVAVLAQIGDDFSFLTYGKERLDLSRLNVDGRPLTVGLNGFVTTDRGLYQPGELIHAMALVRDSTGIVPADLPKLTLRLESRDRILYRVSIRPQDLKLGGADVSLVIPSAVRPGSARVTLALGDTDDALIIGEAPIQFGPVRPDRARLNFVDPDNGWSVRKSAPDTVEISGNLNAQYLFGAADRSDNYGAAGELKAEILIRIASADSPQRGCYEGFSFGLFDDKPTAISTRAEYAYTDRNGTLRVERVSIPVPPGAKPIAVTIEVTLLDTAGPIASASKTFPVADNDEWIGISKIPQLGSDPAGTFGLGADLVLATAARGPNQMRKFGFQLQRESEFYVWEQRDGTWQHMKSVQRDDVKIFEKEKNIQVPDNDGACARAFNVRDIAGGLESGRYLLTVEDKKTGRKSSVRFHTGTTLTDADLLEPNIFTLSVNKPSYRPGETIEVTGQFPFDGPILMAFADGDIRRWAKGDIKNNTATIKIDAPNEWAGKELYVLATLYHANAGGSNKNGPARAIGVASFSVKSGQSGYSVSIQPITDANRKDSIQPDAPLSFRICVSEQSGGPCSGNPPAEAFAIAYVVDEGLLSLTGHHSPLPNPEGHFFGRKRFALRIMDNYDRLLLKDGGDRPTRLALSNYTSAKIFSADCGISPLALDRGSTICTIPKVDLSSGAVSIFAVVWSADYAAAASKSVTVRGRVVADLGAPAFLYAGDSATLPIRLENIDFGHRDFRVHVTSTGSIKRLSFVDGNDKTQALDAAQTETRVRLNPGEPTTAYLNVETSPNAKGKLSLRVSLDAVDSPLPLDANAREWTFDLRPPMLASIDTIGFALQRQSVNLGKKIESLVADRYDPKSVTVTARFSDSPQSLLSAASPTLASGGGLPILDHLVWRGMLVLNMSDKMNPNDQRAQIARIIGEIQALQRADGSFLPYRAIQEHNKRELNLQDPDASGSVRPYLFRTASVLDFLSLASARGHDVPRKSMTSASKFLKSVVDAQSECSFDAAYSVGVLVNLGVADRDNIGLLKKCRDAEMDIESMVAKAASAAAYTKYGLSADAKVIFASLAEDKDPDRFNDLTDFRRAMMFEFLVEAGAPAELRRAVSESLLTSANGLSEGASAWIARSVSKTGSSVLSKLAVSDLTIGGLAAGALRTGQNGVLETRPIPYPRLQVSPVTIGLKTDRPAAGFISIEGVITKHREENRAPAGSLKRRFFDFNTGEEIVLEKSSLKTGDRLVVVLEGTNAAIPTVLDSDGNQMSEGGGPLMVVDLLPSTFQMISNAFPLKGKVDPSSTPLDTLASRGDLRSIHTDADRWVGLIVPESKKDSGKDDADAPSEQKPPIPTLAQADQTDDVEFRQAYLVRVNFTGKFTLPALSIEPTVPPIRTLFSDRATVQVKFREFPIK
jgi:uncharacterized protein YfaS (alpha-2-macroglobulin family)